MGHEHKYSARFELAQQHNELPSSDTLLSSIPQALQDPSRAIDFLLLLFLAPWCICPNVATIAVFWRIDNEALAAPQNSAAATANGNAGFANAADAATKGRRTVNMSAIAISPIQQRPNSAEKVCSRQAQSRSFIDCSAASRQDFSRIAHSYATRRYRLEFTGVKWYAAII